MLAYQWREKGAHIFTSRKRQQVFTGGLTSSSCYTFARGGDFSNSDKQFKAWGL
jgi:hypothetical protein